jgi:hypothetical protein
MAVFAIIVQPDANSAKLAPAINEHFRETSYPIDGAHGWLISANKTAKDVCDILGITDGTNGAAIVLEVASYFGRANPSVWSWIKIHWETGRTT